MDRLLDGVESEEAKRRLHRPIEVTVRALLREQSRHCVLGQLAQTLSLNEEPLLEWRLLQREAGEQVPLVESQSAFESLGRAVGHLALEGRDVDLDRARVESDCLTQDAEWIGGATMRRRLKRTCRTALRARDVSASPQSSAPSFSRG
jgi:hypothetical protein